MGDDFTGQKTQPTVGYQSKEQVVSACPVSIHSLRMPWISLIRQWIS